MNTNRWFWGVAAVLSVNVLLVAASGIQAHMQPQDGLLSPAQQAAPATTNPTTVADRSSSVELSVPSVPSLEEVPAEVPADVKNDPVYQELKKMFGESGGSFETPPLIDTPGTAAAPSMPHAKNKSVPGAAYFQRLDRRLQSATQLCETARSIAAEAAQSAQDGDTQGAAELLQMATQLREMAADLISRQL